MWIIIDLEVIINVTFVYIFIYKCCRFFKGQVMISKLMRMEERIVLDGSVAAAAAVAEAGVAADADGAESADVAADPVGVSGDSDSDSGDSDGGNVDNFDPGSTEQGESVDTALDNALEALDGVELGSSTDGGGLKAIIVNTDIGDIDDLIGAVADGVLVVSFDGDTDNLQDIIDELEALSGGREFDSIGIVTHGNSDGELILASLEQVSAQSLSSDLEQQEFFSALGGLITEDGRIDLVSCGSGAGELGDELISAIAEISGAEVAASIDDTGNENAGGDWDLEKGNVNVVDEYFDRDKISDFDGVLPIGYFDPGLAYITGPAYGDAGAIHIGFQSHVCVHDTSGVITISDSDGMSITLGECYLNHEFNAARTVLMLDLDEIATNNSIEFKEGTQYTLSMSAEFYGKNSGNYLNNAIVGFTFTIGGDPVVPQIPAATPALPDLPGIPDAGDGATGDAPGDSGALEGLIGDIIDGLENGDTQGVLDTINELGGQELGGQGDDGAAADASGSDDGGEGDGGSGSGGFGYAGGASVGLSNHMMVENPFSEIITSQDVQALFDSTIDAFAGLGMDTPEIFEMIQDAMGDTMTTASLVSSCEQALEGANMLVAEVTAMDGGELALSGSGMTAEVEDVADILQGAIDNMVQARGNALIANDLLRVLALNIGDFSERIAENSFSAGVSRLAECNEELAYSYEVLNGVCRVVQEYKELGKPLPVAQLNGMMPEIIASAKNIAGGLSDSGDRASKDVLSFLTRQMQNKGIDKDNLQDQVSAVFKQWHNSLGMSEPVSVQQELDMGVAVGGFVPSEAM